MKIECTVDELKELISNKNSTSVISPTDMLKEEILRNISD